MTTSTARKSRSKPKPTTNRGISWMPAVANRKRRSADDYEQKALQLRRDADQLDAEYAKAKAS